MGLLGFDLYIDNIGDSIAKDVKVVCKTTPQTIPLESNGVYEIKVLPAKEPPARLDIVTGIDTQFLPSQEFDVEITYSNMDNNEQQPIKENYEMKDLIDKFTKESILRR